MGYRDLEPGETPADRAHAEWEGNVVAAQGETRVADIKGEQKRNAAVADAKSFGKAGALSAFFGTLGPGARLLLNVGFVMSAICLVCLTGHVVLWSYNSLTSKDGQMIRAVQNTRDVASTAANGSDTETALRTRAETAERALNELRGQVETRRTTCRQLLAEEQGPEMAATTTSHCSEQLATCQARVELLNARPTQNACNLQIVDRCNEAIRSFCPEATPLRIQPLTRTLLPAATMQ